MRLSSTPSAVPVRGGSLAHLSLLALLVALPLGVPADDGSSQTPQSLFERIAWEAKALAGQSYQPRPNGGVPETLAELDYDQYRKIRFRGDKALWRGEALFEVELFHTGFLYERPVKLHTVAEGRVDDVAFDRSLFSYDLDEELELPSDPGFAGFRLHYPLNESGYADEVIAFLGASYFRMLGRGQVYGASARGLAIDTATSKGEEFPRFREFWLVQPKAKADRVTFYALLDSRSVTGAYRFELEPGGRTVLDVKARLFARASVERLGLAPLTSMFLYGENSAARGDDFRPEVHDSDGLLMHTEGAEWIWRPLTNPDKLRVTALQAQEPAGFGLAQRDRRFGHYLDLESRFERRPGLWVQPRDGPWAKGAVQLVEIPTQDETNDNIAAFWVPDDPLEAGESMDLSYRLSTFSEPLTPSGLAYVQRTRIGRGTVPGDEEAAPPRQRRFVIDFHGGELAGLTADQPVSARIDGPSEAIDQVRTQRLPDGSGWRLSFRLRPGGDEPVDMQAHLQLRGDVLSERWSYVWYPDDDG